MNFAVLGCRHGHIEEFIVQMLEKGHVFKGIFEKDDKLAITLAEKYNVKLFESEEELLNENLDIIGSSAINNKKIDIIEICNQKGIHVMVDKPIVTNIEDLKRLESIIQEGKIQIGMMLTERFNPAIYTLKNLIKSGSLGKLIGFYISKPHKLNAKNRSPWHFSKEENGGLIIDLMIHDFDLLRFLCDDDIDETSGYVKIGNANNLPNFYDDAKVIVKMENGVTALLQTDWWTPDAFWTYGDGRIVCTGTKGKCEVFTTGTLEKRYPHCVLTTSDNEIKTLENDVQSINLTEDFLNRISGKAGDLTHNDIFKASKASIDTDIKVIQIRD